jgi:hypothetical protein
MKMFFGKRGNFLRKELKGILARKRAGVLATRVKESVAVTGRILLDSMAEIGIRHRVTKVLARMRMRKLLSISRHVVCIWRKVIRRQDYGWHWQHILREFGIGDYARWRPGRR